VQSAVIAGFTRVHDPVLLKPFVEPYFAALQTIWQTRTNEIGQQLVIGLFPAQLSSRELLESTQAWLDEVGERWPALTRLVVENADLMRRALAAQARDSG
jgi:aminopeptidase N